MHRKISKLLAISHLSHEQKKDGQSNLESNNARWDHHVEHNYQARNPLFQLHAIPREIFLKFVNVGAQNNEIQALAGILELEKTIKNNLMVYFIISFRKTYNINGPRDLFESDRGSTSLLSAIARCRISN